MPNRISCQACEPDIINVVELTLNNVSGPGAELQGVLICLADNSHIWPITVRNDQIRSTEGTLPVSEARSLSPNVPVGLIQDLEEAERAHFARSYKASVVICRRAFQLGLVERGISDGPLGAMLSKARSASPSLFSDRVSHFAEAIKDFGDAGAHRREDIHPKDAANVIRLTAQALNELFP